MATMLLYNLKTAFMRKSHQRVQFSSYSEFYVNNIYSEVIIIFS